MILVDIKHYLLNHPAATINELSNHFDAEPESIRDMLGIWIKKGKVIKMPAGKGCGGGCGKCSCAFGEFYQWV